MPKRIASVICTAVLCMVTSYGARAGSIPSVEQTAREQFEKVRLEWKENFSGRTVPGLITFCEPGRPVHFFQESVTSPAAKNSRDIRRAAAVGDYLSGITGSARRPDGRPCL